MFLSNIALDPSLVVAVVLLVVNFAILLGVVTLAHCRHPLACYEPEQ